MAHDSLVSIPQLAEYRRGMDQKSIRSQLEGLFGHLKSSIRIGFGLRLVLGICAHARNYAATGRKPSAPAAKHLSALFSRKEKPAPRMGPHSNAFDRLLRHVTDISILRGPVYAALTIERHWHSGNESRMKSVLPIYDVNVTIAHFVT